MDAEATPQMVVDPVCGMKVDPSKARGGSFDHGPTVYYFCSPGCRTKFAADPGGWLKSGPKGMPKAAGAQPVALMRPKRPNPEPAPSTEHHAPGTAKACLCCARS